MAHTGEFYKQTKNINMKQLLSLFLFLVPCLALAQYPSNGNQKVTLGEQTTADGLVYRGVASIDTVRKPNVDTMAYMVLDTTTNIMWHYKKQTSNAWLRLNLLPTDTASMLTPYIERGDTAWMLTNYWRSGRFSGVLPLLNGGTGSATQNFVDLTSTQTVAGAKTFSSAVTATKFNPTANTAAGNGMYLPTTNTLGFSTNGINRITLNANGSFGIGITPGNFSDLTFADPFFDVAGNMQLKGTAENGVSNLSMGGLTYRKAGIFTSIDGQSPNLSFYVASSYNSSSIYLLMYADSLQRLGINTTSPTQKLDVDGNARIRSVAAMGGNSATLYRNSDGVLSTTSSDINKKHNVKPLIYGLNTINQLNPVNFQWNVDESSDIGFIAQDIQNIIPESIETDWNSDLIFKYEKLIPILTKAIQEQQALIKALEQRIINLENK
jgi:hypothetical protein